jgi:hypothetical protein
MVFVFISLLSNLFAREDSNSSWDVEAEEQIKNIINSRVYSNQEISYHYKDQQWNFRVIFSPNSQKLVCQSFDIFCPYLLLTKEVVPNELFNRLKKVSELYKQSLQAGKRILRY